MYIDFKKVEPEMFDECAEVIRNSFITVANDLMLTKENAATNPAFIDTTALRKMYDQQLDMFAVTEDKVTVGFVAIEKAADDTFYMEKLAVLPAFRHKGYGREIIDFVFECVRRSGGKRISIGIINENEVLKNWYMNYGFVETEIKVFKHLPFTVCLMARDV